MGQGEKPGLKAISDKVEVLIKRLTTANNASRPFTWGLPRLLEVLGVINVQALPPLHPSPFLCGDIAFRRNASALASFFGFEIQSEQELELIEMSCRSFVNVSSLLGKEKSSKVKYSLNDVDISFVIAGSTTKANSSDSQGAHHLLSRRPGSASMASRRYRTFDVRQEEERT